MTRKFLWSTIAFGEGLGMGWDSGIVFNVIFRPLGCGGILGMISLLPSPTSPGPSSPGILWPSSLRSAWIGALKWRSTCHRQEMNLLPPLP